MKNLLLLPLVLSLVACLSNPSKEDGFYTWVDERGQVRTVKAPASTKNNPKKSTQKKSNDFNLGEFETEEQVQARLNDSKLFAWQEDGQQRVVETSVSNESNEITEAKVALNATSSGSYASFRTGDYLPWDKVIGNEVNLRQIYNFNEKLERDFVLVDLTDIPKNSRLGLKSYIKADSISVPQMVFLSEGFDNVSDDVIPFEYYFPESWHSYGYMSGSLNIPGDAQYLLIYTSTLTEALQLDEKIIKLTNLGRISFELISLN